MGIQDSGPVKNLQVQTHCLLLSGCMHLSAWSIQGQKVTVHKKYSFFHKASNFHRNKSVI